MLFLFVWVLIAAIITAAGYMLQNDVLGGIGAVMVLMTCAFEVV